MAVPVFDPAQGFDEFSESPPKLTPAPRFDPGQGVDEYSATPPPIKFDPAQGFDEFSPTPPQRVGRSLRFTGPPAPPISNVVVNAPPVLAIEPPELPAVVPTPAPPVPKPVVPQDELRGVPQETAAMRYMRAAREAISPIIGETERQRLNRLGGADEKPLGVLPSAGRFFDYAGDVAVGGVLDTLEGWNGENRTGVPFENVVAAVSQPHIAPGDKRILPSEANVREGASELISSPGILPKLAGVAANISLGIAKSLPKLAAIPATGGASLLGQSIAAGGIFGVDDDGNFSPKQAIIGALFPAVGKLGKFVPAALMGKSIAAGSKAFANPATQKIVEEIGHQSALNAYMLGTQTLKLIQLYQTDPGKFQATIAETIGFNLAFGLIGAARFQKGVPSETKNWLNSTAQRLAAEATSSKIVEDYSPEALRDIFARVARADPSVTLYEENLVKFINEQLGSAGQILKGRKGVTLTTEQRDLSGLSKFWQNYLRIGGLGYSRTLTVVDPLTGQAVPVSTQTKPAGAPPQIGVPNATYSEFLKGRISGQRPRVDEVGQAVAEAGAGNRVPGAAGQPAAQAQGPVAQAAQATAPIEFIAGEIPPAPTQKGVIPNAEEIQKGQALQVTTGAPSPTAAPASHSVKFASEKEAQAWMRENGIGKGSIQEIGTELFSLRVPAAPESKPYSLPWGWYTDTKGFARFTTPADPDWGYGLQGPLSRAYVIDSGFLKNTQQAISQEKRAKGGAQFRWKPEGEGLASEKEIKAPFVPPAAPIAEAPVVKESLTPGPEAGRAVQVELYRVGDRLPAEETDSEGFKTDTKARAAGNSLPVDSLVRRFSDEMIFEKQSDGSWREYDPARPFAAKETITSLPRGKVESLGKEVGRAAPAQAPATIDERDIPKVAERIMAIERVRFRPVGDADTLITQVKESNRRGITGAPPEAQASLDTGAGRAETAAHGLVANTSERLANGGSLAEAATSFLRTSVGADERLTSGAEGRHLQRQALEKWASENGALLTASPESVGKRLSADTGEHFVVLTPDGAQVIKWTWPGTSGQTPLLDAGGVNREASSPLEYLIRVALQNRVFGDGTQVIGFQVFKHAELARKPGGLAIVTSQPFRQAADPANPNPTRDEVVAYLKERGFEPDKAMEGAWMRKDGVLILDARPDNFVKTAAGVFPIDLQMGATADLQASLGGPSAPVFYSRLIRTVEQSQQGKANGAQWKALIRNSKLGANLEEMLLVGVNDLEDGKTYTKQEVLDYLRANEVVVKDVTLGAKPLENAGDFGKATLFQNSENPIEINLQHDSDGRWRWYSEEGDTEVSGDTIDDARETAARSWGNDIEWKEEGLVGDKPLQETHFSTYQLPGANEDSYREVLLTVPPQPTSAASIAVGWRDGHSQYSDIANPIVRLRFNERTTADGKRMLFLEEVQAPQKGEFEKMPALFQKNWREIAAKWALRHAAENGFDSVGWTTGEQQAARYNLSQHVDSILLNKRDNGNWLIEVRKPGNRGYIGIATDVKTSDLESHIGKDLAKQVADNPKETHEFHGEDLQIGGEGLKKLYDVDFRNVVNNLPAVKKAGQKVGGEVIPVGGHRTFSGEADLASLEKLVAVIRRDWESPNRTAEAWRRWNVALDKQADDVMNAMRAGASFDEAMLTHGSVALSHEFGGEFGNRPATDRVHSLSLTPAIRESVMSGQPLAALASVEAARQGRPPVTAKSVAELLSLLDAGKTGLSPKQAEFLRALLDNPKLAAALDGIRFHVTDVLSNRWNGSFFDNLVTIVSGKDPAIGIEEVLHAILLALPKEMQTELERLRVQSINNVLEEIKASDNPDPVKIAALENLRDNPTAGANDFLRRNFPESFRNEIYPYSNWQEFGAQTASKRFEKKAGSKVEGFWQQLKDIIRGFIRALRGLFRSNGKEQDIFDDILAGNFTGEPKARGEMQAAMPSTPRPVALTKEDAQEAQHKLVNLQQNPDLQESYKISQSQADELVSSIPINGGEWKVPSWAAAAVVGEMQDHANLLRDIAQDAFNANQRSEGLRISKQAKKFEEMFTGERIGAMPEPQASLGGEKPAVPAQKEPLEGDSDEVAQIAGVDYQVISKDKLTPEQKARGDARTQDTFSKLGIPGIPDRTVSKGSGSTDYNTVYKVVPDGKNHDDAAAKLVAILTEEIPKQFTIGGDVAFVSSLINAVNKNFNLGTWQEVFSQPALESLVNITAGHASRVGTMLRAITGIRDDINAIAQNAGLRLKWIYAEAFDPDGTERKKARDKGETDDEKILRRLAKKQKWNVPTQAEIDQVRKWAEEERRLRTPTEKELLRFDGDEDRALEAVEAATRDARQALLRKMNAKWSEWTRPLIKSWRDLADPEKRYNTATAFNEWMAANLLAKLGFGGRQILDVGFQVLLHTPTRAASYAWEQWRNDKSAGRDANLVGALSQALIDSYRIRAKTARDALTASLQTLKGRGEQRNVEQLLTSISVFDRMLTDAEQMRASGKPAAAQFLKILAITVRFGRQFAAAIDVLQGVPAEAQEIALQIRTALKEQGRSRGEVDAQFDALLGLIQTKRVEAESIAHDIMAARGLETDRGAVKRAAWHILREMIYHGAREAGLPADEWKAQNALFRNLIGWNLSETKGLGGEGIGGPGGLAALTGKAGKEMLAGWGVPGFPFVFANAIGISLNRKLAWTPLGFFPRFFKGSPWFEGERNQRQRKIEATLGTGIQALVFALVAMGIWKMLPLFWPRDDKERAEWVRKGWKPGMLLIPWGDGKEIHLSGTVGPMGYFAPSAAAGAAYRRGLDQQGAKQKRLDEEAAKHGLTAEQLKGLDASQWLGVMADAAYASLMGGRTASGMVGSYTDFGQINPKKITASAISSLAPLVPGFQEVSRMQGVWLDPKTSSMWDLIVPLESSGHQRVNLLGQPMRDENSLRRVLQVLSGGTYPFPEAQAETGAYATLFASDYRPPAINPGRGYQFGSAYRPMNGGELQAYTQARGEFFRQELEGLGVTDDKKAVAAAFQRANTRALESVGVTVPVSSRATSAGRATQSRAEWVGPASTTTSAAPVSTPQGGARAPGLRRTGFRASRRVGLRRGPSLRRGRSLGGGRIRVPSLRRASVRGVRFASIRRQRRGRSIRMPRVMA